MKPVIVIGAGHNGLTAAFYLAKAGLKPIVLERREMVGGAGVTEVFAPGFRSSLAHATGPLRASVVRDMDLERRVEFVRPDPRLCALAQDGHALTFSTDVARTAAAIRAFSESDANRYAEFCGVLERLGRFLQTVLEAPPPSLNASSPGDLWEWLKTGRHFRALARADAFRLLRWMPMAVADLVAEWFTTDLLMGALAARGVFGASQGPWSAGTGALLLLNAAIDPAPGGSSINVKGGAGALTAAMADAAGDAGAEIRTNVAVARLLVRDRRAVGVVLEDGTEIEARAVVANTDPKRTLLQLVDPGDLDPGFLLKIRNYRMPGTVAKLDFALGALPSFRAVPQASDLRARLHIGPSIDYLEHAFDAAKYGEISPEPYLDVAFPSISDPSLAPPGRHVMSVYLQCAPYKLANGRTWPESRGLLQATVLRTLERYAPGISQLVESARVITPLDLETNYGLTGGHIFHGEPSLDQLFTMRPLLGWARYQTPIDGLFLCGAGTHPGGGLTAGSGQNAAREIISALKRRTAD